LHDTTIVDIYVQLVTLYAGLTDVHHQVRA